MLGGSEDRCGINRHSMRATRGAGRTRLRAGGRHKGVSGSNGAGRVRCWSVPGTGRGEQPQVTMQCWCSFPSGELIRDKGAAGLPSASHLWWGTVAARPTPPACIKLAAAPPDKCQASRFYSRLSPSAVHHSRATVAPRSDNHHRSAFIIDSRSYPPSAASAFDISGLFLAFRRLEIVTRWKPTKRPFTEATLRHPSLHGRHHGCTTEQLWVAAVGNRSAYRLQNTFMGCATVDATAKL